MVVALLTRGLERGSLVSFCEKDLAVLKGVGFWSWEAMGEGPRQVTMYLLVVMTKGQRRGLEKGAKRSTGRQAGSEATGTGSNVLEHT